MNKIQQTNYLHGTNKKTALLVENFTLLQNQSSAHVNRISGKENDAIATI